jgi:dTMP kinase
MADLLFDPNEDKSHLINAEKRLHRGRLINLEGTDASGKSTQIELICDYLDGIGKTYKKVHFPMYGSNKFAEVISMFLRGDLGKNDEVDPLFVANIYAMDRYKYKPQLYKDLDEYDYVILDRYVFSNMGFQGAKYKIEEKRQSIIKWINDFEFEFLKLPYPDLIIYFDLPIDIVSDRLKKRDEEEDRDYLKGKKDIHESDLSFQSSVRRIYLGLDTFENYKIIKCVDDNGHVLNPTDLFEKYKYLI